LPLAYKVISIVEEPSAGICVCQLPKPPNSLSEVGEDSLTFFKTFDYFFFSELSVVILFLWTT